MKSHAEHITMKKQEFLTELQNGLTGFPQDVTDECLAFYTEMIDDRMEEGMTEEEAIAAIGSVKEIVAQMTADIPLMKLVKERIAPKRGLRAWEVVLLILGFPLWFPLILAAVVVIFSLYLVIWAVLISFWAVAISCWVSAVGLIVASAVFALQGHGLTGIAAVGIGIFCIGFSILITWACLAASKGIVKFTKIAAIGIKRKCMKRGRTA